MSKRWNRIATEMDDTEDERSYVAGLVGGLILMRFARRQMNLKKIGDMEKMIGRLVTLHTEELRRHGKEIRDPHGALDLARDAAGAESSDNLEDVERILHDLIYNPVHYPSTD